MNTKKSIVIPVLLVILALVITGGIFFAFRLRSSHYEGSAIATELALIDASIKAGDTKAALSSLSRIERRSSSVLDRIGIYKRYITLGEYNRAEKCLLKTLRHHSSDQRLIALYSSLLIHQNRIKEALKYSKTLSGTEYGSLYAEACLREAIVSNKNPDEFFGKKNKFLSFFKKKEKNTLDEQNDKLFFSDSRFIPIYKDAYAGSKISLWMMNAATILMKSGDFIGAADLYPGEVSEFKDALFWGIVFYDNADYSDSLTVLLKADDFTKEQTEMDVASAIELRALESDDYYILGDDKSAQLMREKMLEVSSPYMNAFMDDKIPVLNRLMPLLFMNTALYSRDNGDLIKQYNKLFELVNYYPYYEPGLAAYAEYSIESLTRPEEGSIDKQIRAAGLKTLDMEDRDAVPVVQIEEVLSRIDIAMKENPSPNLIVLQEVMNTLPHRHDEKNEKASRVWSLLEENEISSGLYPPEIVRYCVNLLLENGDGQNAEKIFGDYLQAMYTQKNSGTDSSRKNKEVPVVTFFDPCEHPEKMRLWELEDAAYFYVQNENYDGAMKLYSYILATFTKRVPVFNTEGQNEIVTYSYINMANIYSGYNRTAQSLDYLGKANGRVKENLLKAEILYRMASDSWRLGNERDAVRSLQYALQLNPSHNRARLLLKKVQ